MRKGGFLEESVYSFLIKRMWGFSKWRMCLSEVKFREKDEKM